MCLIFKPSCPIHFVVLILVRHGPHTLMRVEGCAAAQAAAAKVLPLLMPFNRLAQNCTLAAGVDGITLLTAAAAPRRDKRAAVPTGCSKCLPSTSCLQATVLTH